MTGQKGSAPLPYLIFNPENPVPYLSACIWKLAASKQSSVWQRYGFLLPFCYGSHRPAALSLLGIMLYSSAKPHAQFTPIFFQQLQDSWLHLLFTVQSHGCCSLALKSQRFNPLFDLGQGH